MPWGGEGQLSRWFWQIWNLLVFLVTFVLTETVNLSSRRENQSTWEETFKDRLQKLPQTKTWKFKSRPSYAGKTASQFLIRLFFCLGFLFCFVFYLGISQFSLSSVVCLYDLNLILLFITYSFFHSWILQFLSSCAIRLNLIPHSSIWRDQCSDLCYFCLLWGNCIVQQSLKDCLLTNVCWPAWHLFCFLPIWKNRNLCNNDSLASPQQRNEILVTDLDFYLRQMFEKNLTKYQTVITAAKMSYFR